MLHSIPSPRQQRRPLPSLLSDSYPMVSTVYTLPYWVLEKYQATAQRKHLYIDIFLFKAWKRRHQILLDANGDRSGSCHSPCLGGSGGGVQGKEEEEEEEKELGPPAPPIET